MTSDKTRFLSDDEYERLEVIRQRHTIGEGRDTAYDIGYLLALIFRLKDRLERGGALSVHSHRRSSDV